MTITRLKLEEFTAFESLDFEPSPGINVLIGANGVGKTHLLKVIYAACDITKSERGFAEKLVGVFLPSRRSLGRLVRRKGKSATAKVEVSRGDDKIVCTFSNHAKSPTAKNVRTGGAAKWFSHDIECVYIPVKEMLANAPGFRSLNARREVHFEEIYADIIDRAFLPTLRGPKDVQRRQLLALLQEAMDGKIIEKNEEFFLKNRQGELEFTLLAEGLRKFGLLWLLIQNGVLASGSVLFWDEPETNLNPRLFSVVIEILLHLQRAGVQIFISTHDYAILKEFELAAKPTDEILFGALYRAQPGDGVTLEIAPGAFSLANSPIEEAMTSLYDREIQQSFSE